MTGTISFAKAGTEARAKIARAQGTRWEPDTSMRAQPCSHPLIEVFQAFPVKCVPSPLIKVEITLRDGRCDFLRHPYGSKDVAAPADHQAGTVDVRQLI